MDVEFEEVEKGIGDYKDSAVFLAFNTVVELAGGGGLASLHTRRGSIRYFVRCILICLLVSLI